DSAFNCTYIKAVAGTIYLAHCHRNSAPPSPGGAFVMTVQFSDGEVEFLFDSRITFPLPFLSETSKDSERHGSVSLEMSQLEDDGDLTIDTHWRVRPFPFY
ncbi:MAG TPA: hypothetical protein VE914_04530, partial [Candidatus Angelobacter sp.]|nr:hypothetical protein [Candidatus Angelobacter sp.]